MKTYRARTDASGVLHTTYKASVFNGRTKITAKVGSLSTDAYVDVKVPSLEELFEGDNYELTGFVNIPSHPQGTNHWGTSDANNGLVVVAQLYKDKYYANKLYPASEKLLYNDQSLPQGGKFDIDHNWAASGSHLEHRLGINCDVSFNRVPIARRGEREIKLLFFNAGSTDTLTESDRNHWHLRFEFGQDIPNSYASSRETYITEALWSALEREPNEAEWQEWTSRFETAQAQGQAQTFAEAKALLYTQFLSVEYANRNRSDADYVTDLFSGYFRREPTADEHAQNPNQLQTDNAQGLNGRAMLRHSFESSPGFAAVVSQMEGTATTPTCNVIDEQDCYNNGGSWNANSCQCSYPNPDPIDPCYGNRYGNRPNCE